MGNSRYYNYGGRVSKAIDADEKFKLRTLDRAAQRKAQRAEAKQWASNKLDKLLVGTAMHGAEAATAESLFLHGDTVNLAKVSRLQREINKRARSIDKQIKAIDKQNKVKLNVLSLDKRKSLRMEREQLGYIQTVLNKDKNLAGSKAYAYIDAKRTTKSGKKGK